MTNSIELTSTEGKNYTLSIPSSLLKFPSSFVFAFAKSGSTLLDRLVRDYCKEIEVPSFSLFGAAFNLGVNPAQIAEDAKAVFSQEGVIYTGFRHYPKHFDIDLSNAKCIWLTRDPRDMLVSLYFSIAKSHVVQEGDNARLQEREIVNAMDIDSFVLSRAKSYLSNFEIYRNKLPKLLTKIIRYEDVIYDKHTLLKSIAEHFELTIDHTIIEKIAKKHDSIPGTEQTTSHIRQVHPGNYKAKLMPDTISKLNIDLECFLNFFNYQT